MLPDAASGHDPDTLADFALRSVFFSRRRGKLSRRAPRERSEQRGYKEVTAWFLQIQVQVLLKPGVSWYKFDRSREFIPGYKVGDGYWRSVAVQAVPEPENCHGAGFLLRAGAGVRVQVSAGFVLGAGVKAKTMTNNLPIALMIKA